MASYYVKSGVATLWAAAQVVSTGARRVPQEAYATVAAKGYVFECTTGGTTHATTEPTWPTTPGNTVNDNGVIWTCREATTWANAAAFIHYLFASLKVAANDVVYVASTHSESVATGSGSYWGGSWNIGEATVKILSVDSAGSPEPPTALLAGATIGGASALSIGWTANSVGCSVYIYGLYFVATNADIEIGAIWANLVVIDCKFTLASGTGTQWVTFGSQNNYVLNPIFKFSATGQTVGFATNADGTYVEMVNASVDGAGTIPTKLISAGFGRYCRIARMEITASDFSSFNTGNAVYSAIGSHASGGVMVLMNSALNANATLIDAAVQLPAELSVEGYVFGPSMNLLKFERAVYGGTSTIDTATFFTTGGAVQKGSKYSEKIVTNAEPSFGFTLPIRSRWLHVWNELTGVAKTLTLEFLHDSVTNLKNNEVWIEYEYYGTAGSCKSTWVSTAPSILAAGSNLAAGAGASAWTKSMTNPNSQKIAVSLTPQEVGMMRARVCFAKASYTLYFDPQMRLT
jgi:hypothetical protein